MRVLIVDDEPIALDILETYLQKVPGAVLVARCKNALEAFGILSRQEVDLMFLDINMPEITGLDFLKTLKNPPLVVLSTAYSEFALQGYEMEVLDYLLKPFSFERFLQAVEKAGRRLRKSDTPAQPAVQEETEDLIFVKAEGKLVRLDLQQLMYVEGLKDYVIIKTTEGQLIVHSTMKNLEEQLLTRKYFLRVHKSYLVNIRFVKEMHGHALRIQEQMIPVGNTYREEVASVFEKFRFL